MLDLRRLARATRRPAVLLALSATLALAGGAVTGCAGTPTQDPTAPTQEQTGQPGQTAPEDETSLASLQLADLLADPSGAYGALADDGLTWRGNGTLTLAAEAWPDAMADTDESHPIHDALESLGVAQPAVGEDYFVGPAYVCLGTGLVLSSSDAAGAQQILAPDEVSAGATPDSVALCAPISGILADEQVDELASAAGLTGDARDFLFDDSGKTNVFTGARAGLMTIGEKDCVWYVQQYGSVAEGGTSVLRIGALPVEAARSLVDASGLVSIGQLGAWDQAASDAERLELFATVVSQEAIMSGPSWTNVLTGESMQWDQASGSWVVAS